MDRAGRLAISGGSNGGLLVGAALTQRPDLYAAVVCSAPLLDMVRYEQFGLGRTWNDEYGTADDPRELDWLLSYSPYHHVVDDTPYPAVLFTVFDSDTRVDPMHARKMCAALQYATSSDRPILLRRETDVGHGARALSRSIDLSVDTLSVPRPVDRADVAGRGRPSAVTLGRVSPTPTPGAVARPATATPVLRPGGDVCARGWRTAAGRTGSARSSDWFIQRPFQILLIIVVAIVVRAVVRRVISRLASQRGPGHRARRSEPRQQQAARDGRLAVAVGTASAARRDDGVAAQEHHDRRHHQHRVHHDPGRARGEHRPDPVPAPGSSESPSGSAPNPSSRTSSAASSWSSRTSTASVTSSTWAKATGVVESVGLRVTRLRALDGAVWYVRNGEVIRVGNNGQGWARPSSTFPWPTTRTSIACPRPPADRERRGGRGTVQGHGSRTTRGVGRRDAVAGCGGHPPRRQDPAGEEGRRRRALRQRIKTAFDEHEVERPVTRNTLVLENAQPRGPGTKRICNDER